MKQSPAENKFSNGQEKIISAIPNSTNVKKILGGTLLALASVLGGGGCKESVIIGEGDQLPNQDAGQDVVLIDAANDQADEEADAGNEGDAYLDSDSPENDPNAACNRVDIFRSDGKGSAEPVPKGATNIRLLCFDLYTGCQTGDIGDLHFTDYGQNSGHMKVYIAESNPPGARLTEIKNGNDANFEGMKLPVELYNGDGKFSSYCLYGNLDKDAQAGQSYNYALVKPDTTFMSNHPKVFMENPVVGDPVLAGNVDAITIKAEEAASVPQVNLEHGTHGHIGVIALEQSLLAAGRMQRVSLKVGGTCDTSTIKNLTLNEGADATSVLLGGVNENGMVNFPILYNPYNLNAGAGTTLYLDADQNCNPGENISVYLEQPSDLYVTDLTYGVGESVEGTFCGNGPDCKPSIVYIK